MKDLTEKKLIKEDWDLLKGGKHVCPPYGVYRVGRTYKIVNPENKNEVIKARCTQNCPFALIKI